MCHRCTVYAKRTAKAPQLSKPIDRAEWGSPAIVIDKDTPNTVLFSHNAEVEDIRRSCILYGIEMRCISA